LTADKPGHLTLVWRKSRFYNSEELQETAVGKYTVKTAKEPYLPQSKR